MEDFIPLTDLLACEDLDDMAPEQEAEIIEEKIIIENIQTAIKLDYSLKTCEERAELVNQIVARTPSAQLTNRYLEILGDYIMGAISKEEKKAKLYMTDNRMITINKRETSFEGLAEKFENGEDGLYNLITNDKNVLLTPKVEITDEDIENIPGLKELRENIKIIEEQAKRATGKSKYLLKKQLIEMRKDQYTLKNIFKQPMYCAPSSKGVNKIDLFEQRYVDENGNPQSTGLITFFNPKHIAAILANYNALKIETKGRFWDDFYYLMEDFDALMEKALKPYPAYLDIVHMKVAGKANIEIQEMLINKYNIQHSIQYISQLWTTKIPKIIAEKEQHDFLIWYYGTQEKGPMKRCSCCKELKPANARFFSRNKTAKDGWYSQCKVCRNTKTIKKS